MAETRPRAGGALEMTKPEEVAAQVGVDRRGGATRLDSAVAAERDGERGGGVPGAGRGNGVGAGVRRGTAMPMAVVAQRGSDGSGGGARLEVTRGSCGSGARWMWCFGGVLWKRSGGRISDGVIKEVSDILIQLLRDDKSIGDFIYIYNHRIGCSLWHITDGKSNELRETLWYFTIGFSLAVEKCWVCT
uniref:DUF834 domain-containing protein n=1 Tax=Oryza sativa subsp. japonica TaxID=39947 RepID=Q2R3M4_ORYSJ|nr:hypothetical protein LOC_Os11g31440 [Oryza sativa Japonica Group]